MKNETGLGIVGTCLSAIGTAIQTNEILQTISLIITILGGLISFIVIPILNWHRNAKKDGKIDLDELEDGIDVISEGLDKLNDEIKKGEGNGKD